VSPSAFRSSPEPAKDSSSRFESILGRFRTQHVLVIGDLLLDEYRVGDVDRISPEAPVPVVRVAETRFALGGAGNVARGIVSLSASCDLVGLVGRDAEGDRMLSLLQETGVAHGGVVATGERPTPHKLRVVARAQQMLRLDREDDRPISAELSARIRDRVASRLPGASVVVLQDYDKGLFGEGLGSWVIERARALGIPTVADPKSDLARFRGAALIKPNLAEAQRYESARSSDFEGRRAMLEKIQRGLGGGAVVVTRGREGISALDEKGEAWDVPTRPAEVFDVQGAGDTSIATLALARATGAGLRDACIVANAAAAVAVEKVGTATVGLDELRDRLPDALAVLEGET